MSEITKTLIDESNPVVIKLRQSRNTLEQDRNALQSKCEALMGLIEELNTYVQDHKDILYHFPCGDKPCVLCRLKQEAQKLMEKP